MEVGKLYISKSHLTIVKCVAKLDEQSFWGCVIEGKLYSKNYYQRWYINDFTLYHNIEPSNNVEEGSNIQIGGDHYKKLKIQPTEFIHANEIPFIEGNIIKYVIRHRDKNGIEDLKKARHYIDLLIQFEYENTKKL